MGNVSIHGLTMPYSPEQILQIVEERRWQITPVVEKSGSKKSKRLKVVHWSVGNRVLAGDGWRNISTWLEKGSTIADAFEKAISLHGEDE